MMLRPSKMLAALLLGPLVLLVAWAGPGAHGPDGQHLDAPSTASASAGLARLPDGSVHVPKLAQRRMGLLTTLATRTEAAATVALPGRVVADPNHSGRVQPAHGGRIEAAPQGLPVPGQTVRRGQVLAYVAHHPEHFAQGNQEAQWAELQAQRTLAEQRVKRLEGLEGTVPRKEIDAARTELAGLVDRAGAVGRSLHAREALLAPVSGVIARMDVVLGQVVEPREVLFEVVDPSRMLVEATTTEVQLGSRVASAALQEAGGARLRLLGAARALREGVLPLIFSVQGDAAGAPLPLALGQPVTVLVALNERTRGFVLPAQAVVRNPANEPVVWIKAGVERFIAQPVRHQPLDAARVLVSQGLGDDNRVVVQGAALLAQIR